LGISTSKTFDEHFREATFHNDGGLTLFSLRDLDKGVGKPFASVVTDEDVMDVTFSETDGNRIACGVGLSLAAAEENLFNQSESSKREGRLFRVWDLDEKEKQLVEVLYDNVPSTFEARNELTRNNVNFVQALKVFATEKGELLMLTNKESLAVYKNVFKSRSKATRSQAFPFESYSIIR
jgi:hypothetical protein